MTLDEIKKEIEKAKTIAILVHDNPDGDAIGSAIAMSYSIEQLGNKADIIIPEYPSNFEFLPKTKEFLKESENKNYDLAIALDCGSQKQVHGYEEYFETAKTKVVIDHHRSNPMYGDFNYVDEHSPAVCQLLLAIFNYYNIEITKEIGEAILSGIITDTGGFRYDSVTEETFDFVAELYRKGIKVSDVYQRVFSDKTISKFKLRQIAMNRYELLEDGKVAYTYITKEDEKNVNAQNGDHDGIVEIGRDIDSVEVSFFLRETDKGIKGSIRSKNYVNVSEISMMFGGGGHIRAAGFTIDGDMEKIKEQVLLTIKGYLE